MTMAHSALGKILLVVFLSGVERRCLGDLGDDRPPEFSRSLHPLFRGEGDAFLLRRMEKDRRPVLRPNVWALTVQGCGIVRGPEDVQKFLVADLRRVESHLYHFR